MHSGIASLKIASDLLGATPAKSPFFGPVKHLVDLASLDRPSKPCAFFVQPTFGNGDRIPRQSFQSLDLRPPSGRSRRPVQPTAGEAPTTRGTSRAHDHLFTCGL